MKLRRTAEDFRQQVEKRHITTWQVKECPACHAPLGFIFIDNGNVYYNGGCHCNPRKPISCDFQTVATAYNMIEDPKALAEANAVWGFKNYSSQDVKDITRKMELSAETEKHFLQRQRLLMKGKDDEDKPREEAS